MRTRGLVGTTMWAAVTVVVVGLPGVPAHAMSVKVTNNADFGAGSFRDAVEAANADDRISSIRFDRNLGPIGLESTVQYSGEQSLSIDGRGATIEPALAGSFDLFVADGGADLTLKNLIFQNGEANGVIVDVPSDREGIVSVRLDNVGVHDNDLFGLRIQDAGASPASLRVDIQWSSFTGNGTAELDQDGARVDETGDGDIDAFVTNSTFDGNGADGLELDESGDGDVVLTALHSTFDGNGFQDIEEDPDDGLDIDEAGAGDIQVHLVNVSASDNEDEGIDFDEEDEGHVELSFNMVSASGNVDEGIKADEEDEGDLEAELRNVESDGSADQEGAQLEEVGDGDVFVRVVNSSFTNNDNEGLQVEQGDAGEGLLRLQHVFFSGNGDGPFSVAGVDVVEVGAP